MNDELMTEAPAAVETAPSRPRKKTRKRRAAMTSEQKNLAAKYMPLAKSLSKPLKRAWPLERDEFEAAAYLALVEAAQSFDPSRNVKFSTFARYRIWGALRDLQRDMFLPTGCSELDDVPMFTTLTAASEEAGRIFDHYSDDPRIGEELESIDFVEYCFRHLPAKHAEACRQIYIEGKTQSKAAEALGCSKSRLSYLHKEAIEIINETSAYKDRHLDLDDLAKPRG